VFVHFVEEVRSRDSSFHILIKMNFRISGLVNILFFCINFASSADKKLVYPEILRDETIIDDYHGVKVVS